jgi:hypothetical protein
VCLVLYRRQQGGPLARTWASPTYSLEVAFDTARELEEHIDDYEAGASNLEPLFSDEMEEEHEMMLHKGGKSDWRAAGRHLKGKQAQQRLETFCGFITGVSASKRASS